MEKNTIEIARDFESRIEELKARILELEQEFAAFREKLEPPPAPAEDLPEEAPAAAEPVDVEIDIDVLDIPAPQGVVAQETVPVEPEPEEPEPEEPAAEPVEEPATEPVPGDLPEADDLPLDILEPAPEVLPAAEPPKKALRTAEGNYAWKTAMPGMPVKNIRSAISLFDRALFINTLFKEDYALYDRTIGELNALSSTEEAVDYILGHFPDWNLGSDVVYSFIMAIRKKLG